MNLKPDILEKGEALIDNINGNTLPEIQSTLKNVNTSILPNVQESLKGVTETLLQVNKIIPLVIVTLSLVAVAALGTFAGVLVLLLR
ncbi:MAG: hypothetical protein K6G80_06235 [Treponema sp.]|nr:hypothetical protein [Treponema sp.]